MLLIVYIIAYILYLELSPGLGGIWLRPNDTGALSVSISSFWAMISYPFSHINMWNPRNWDINPWPILFFIYVFGL